MKNLILLFFSALAWGCCETPKYEISLRPSEYVTTLVGTQSDYSLSTGNTYPAVALPWGMNFWTCTNPPFSPTATSYSVTIT